MPILPVSAAALKAHRAKTYRSSPSRRLRTADQAVEWVNERGFTFFWPIKGIEMPSLWTAVAGDRPVADKHGDPGHVTWGWKDGLLGARRWHYGKLLRGKSTIVSLDVLPYFYALSENYGDDADYLWEYEAGRLSQEARQVHEALASGGPLDSLSLRRESRLAGKESSSRFDRALTELQRGLRIVPVGIAEAGAWKYAFVYELLDRWLPELPEQARPIGRAEARAHLAHLYILSVGASTRRSLTSLFTWRPDDVSKAVDSLVGSGHVCQVSAVEGTADDWLVLPQLQ
jgi:hypothetical protein